MSEYDESRDLRRHLLEQLIWRQERIEELEGAMRDAKVFLEALEKTLQSRDAHLAAVIRNHLRSTQGEREEGGEMSEVDAVFERDAMTELALEALEESDESAYTYLAYGWLSSAIEKLYDARRQAKLTQKDVAQRLGTKQPAIACLERDDEGKVSLHRYIEVALACGFLPLDISLKPVEALREYALNDPDAPRTETAFEAWNSEALGSNEGESREREEA